MSHATSNDPLQLSVGPDGAIVVGGDIDLAGGPLLEAAFEHAAADGEVVIDLGGVSFIDSSGLRSLLAVTRRAADRGTDVVLRAPTSAIRRLLEITGTQTQFVLDPPSADGAA